MADMGFLPEVKRILDACAPIGRPCSSPRPSTATSTCDPSLPARAPPPRGGRRLRRARRGPPPVLEDRHHERRVALAADVVLPPPVGDRLLPDEARAPTGGRPAEDDRRLVAGDDVGGQRHAPRGGGLPGRVADLAGLAGVVGHAVAAGLVLVAANKKDRDRPAWPRRAWSDAGRGQVQQRA